MGNNMRFQCRSQCCNKLIIGPSLKGASEDGMLHGKRDHAVVFRCADAGLDSQDAEASRQKIVQTVSNSPLCHVSVGKWMKKSGYALGSPERKDRCARVTASVAYKL